MTRTEKMNGHCSLPGTATFFILLLAAAALAGCGGGGGGDNGGTTSSDVAASYVGITECYTCHADGLLEEFEEERVFSTWLNGPHGNYESVDQSFQIVDMGENNVGFPYFGYEGLGTDPSCTTSCHDQLGDGTLLEAFYSETGITALGIVNRPVVGCESCHGSGSDHFGVGEMQYPRPGPDRCGQCHNEDFPDGHLAYHPEGSDIYEDYAASPHGASVNVFSQALCSRCHSDEGARAYVGVADGTEGVAELESKMAGKDDIEDPSNVQCRTCHDHHDPDRLLLSAGADALGNTLSAEYRTCTACHQLLGSEGERNESYHASWGSAHTITDTHYDDPSTPELEDNEPVDDTGGIEGYVIDPSNDRACRDCHNPHNADTTINDQWANSGHGGTIAQAVSSSTGVANVTDSVSAAWTHYNWKYMGDPDDPEDTGRQECQKCHTSTGFKNLADDPTGYDADGDGVPDTQNVFTATEGQAEMLYCWACHTSNAGDIRDPGPFVNTASYTAPSDRISAVPDIGGSNLCVVCHSGRISGGYLKGLDFDTEIYGQNFGSFNPHYLAAGGVLFRTVGFEFNGVDYGNSSYFVHDKIGTSAVSDTGENGPCVGCHMRGDAGHTFESAETDSGGSVTEILSYTDGCSACHADYDELVSTLNELEEGFDAALSSLEAQLAAQGIYHGSGYPYFFTSADSQSFGTAFKNWPDTDTLGAAFNLKLLNAVPGAYAHNSLYVKRLIYDSIDYLDNGALDSSVEATLGGSGTAYGYLAGTRP